MARWVLLMLMLMLVAMLVVPIWLKRNNDDKLKEPVKAEAKAESDMNTTYTAARVAAAVVAAGPIGFGLTFAVSGPTDPLAALSYLSCQGDPRPTDKPEKDACNPYQGDTSCSVVIPVLCMNSSGIVNPAPANANPLANWTAGTLGATPAVMGALLESRPIADARCEKALGQGWRTADFRAGGNGWSLRGHPGPGLSPSGPTQLPSYPATRLPGTGLPSMTKRLIAGTASPSNHGAGQAAADSQTTLFHVKPPPI